MQTSSNCRIHTLQILFRTLQNQKFVGTKHFEAKVEVKVKAKAKLPPVKNSGGCMPPEFVTGGSLALALALTLTSTLTSKCFVPYNILDL